MCVCVYVYTWITLLYSRNEHNIVNQLYFNKRNFRKGKKWISWFTPKENCMLYIKTQNSGFGENSEDPASFNEYSQVAKWSEADSFFCEGKSIPHFTNIPSFPVVLTFLKFLSGCCMLLGLWCHTSEVKKSKENFQLRVENEMEIKIIEWK